MLVRVDDTVEVITGDDRSVRGRVLSVDWKAGKLLVEGVNRVYKHVRRSQKHPQGGRLSKEMPVQLSNLMYVCPSCSERTRLGARFTDDGAKQRYCKRCGASAGEIAPAHASHAKK